MIPIVLDPNATPLPVVVVGIGGDGLVDSVDFMDVVLGAGGVVEPLVVSLALGGFVFRLTSCSVAEMKLMMKAAMKT